MAKMAARMLMLGAVALGAQAGVVARDASITGDCPDPCIIQPINGGPTVDLSHLDDVIVNLTLGDSIVYTWSFKWCVPRPSRICPAWGDERGHVFVDPYQDPLKCKNDTWMFPQLTQSTIEANDRIILTYTDTHEGSHKDNTVTVSLYCDESLPKYKAVPTTGKIDDNYPSVPERFFVDFNTKIACGVSPVAPVVPAPVPRVPVAPLPPVASKCMFQPPTGGPQIDLSVLKNWEGDLGQGSDDRLSHWEINWCQAKMSTRCTYWNKPAFLFQSDKDSDCGEHNWVMMKFVQVTGGNGDPVVVTYEDTQHHDGSKDKGTMTILIECDLGGSIDTVVPMTVPGHIDDNWPSFPERMTTQFRGKIACKNSA